MPRNVPSKPSSVAVTLSSLPRWLFESLEQIDAGVFSGDTFHDDYARQTLRDYMGRWKVGLKEVDRQRREQKIEAERVARKAAQPKKGIEDFRRTHNGGEFLEKHALDETGTWQIYGEDPNCDMTGYHSSPLLETVTGKLSDVIVHAVNLEGFWNWGCGGYLKKISIKEVGSSQ